MILTLKRFCHFMRNDTKDSVYRSQIESRVRAFEWQQNF